MLCERERTRENSHQAYFNSSFDAWIIYQFSRAKDQEMKLFLVLYLILLELNVSYNIKLSNLNNNGYEPKPSKTIFDNNKKIVENIIIASVSNVLIKDLKICKADDFYESWPYQKPEDILNYIYSNSEKGNFKTVVKAMDDFASYYPMYKLSPQKVKLIERCINTFKPIQILEIGTFFGYSALHIAKAMTDNSKLTCIEANPQNADIAKKILNYAFYNQPNILKRVNIITGISTNVLNSNIMNEVVFKNHTTPVLFDFVFLDHDKNSYLPDLIRLEELSLISNQKCLLVADNVLYPGAPEYLNYLNRNNSISPNFRWKTTYEYFPFERVGFETNFKEVKDAMSISTNIMN